MTDRFSAIVLGCLLLAAVSQAQAQPRDEDVEYSSDGGGSIETVDGVRITTLQGNVNITRGQTRITGDTATLEQDPDSGELQHVTVTGDPARFRRETEDAENPITGHSDTIHYFTRDNDDGETETIVEFVGSASFTRGRTALQCSEIRHVVETEATDSPGPCSGVVTPQDQ